MPFVSSYTDRWLIIAVINKEVGIFSLSRARDMLFTSFLIDIVELIFILIFFSPAPPNITMPIPGTAVRTLTGRLTAVCKATGTSPVYVALMWNSIVLVNETNTAVTRLYWEGNYHCIATNNYGTDTRVIPVFFISKKNFCSFISGIINSVRLL